VEGNAPRYKRNKGQAERLAAEREARRQTDAWVRTLDPCRPELDFRRSAGRVLGDLQHRSSIEAFSRLVTAWLRQEFPNRNALAAAALHERRARKSSTIVERRGPGPVGRLLRRK